MKQKSISLKKDTSEDLSRLPNVIWAELLKHISIEDIGNLLATNKTLRHRLLSLLMSDHYLKKFGNDFIHWLIQHDQAIIIQQFLDKKISFNVKKALYTAISHASIKTAVILKQAYDETLPERSCHLSLFDIVYERGHFNFNFLPSFVKATKGEAAIPFKMLKSAENFAEQKNKFEQMLYLRLIYQHPNINHHPIKLIRKAFNDYSKASWGSRILAAIGRFFHGRWGNHYGDVVTQLLLKPQYSERNFTHIHTLKEFLEELTQKIKKMGRINPQGDIYRILSLTATLTKVDVTKHLKQRKLKRDSGPQFYTPQFYIGYDFTYSHPLYTPHFLDKHHRGFK